MAVPFVRSPNIGGALTATILVMHYTATGPDFDTAAYFARPSAKVSAHLVIRRDGTAVQCVPFNRVGWHAGKSAWVNRSGRNLAGLNAEAIGIELENWGPLRRAGSGWVSWTGAPVDPDRVSQARHRFGTPQGGWEIFPEAQVAAATEAARAICGAYAIDEIVGHDDIAPGRKSDPGPLWAMASFRARVFGRAESGGPHFVVRSPTGLNIRSGPGAGHPTTRPDPLPSGTLVLLHQAREQWRYVTVLDPAGQPSLTGWVHGAYLFEA